MSVQRIFIVAGEASGDTLGAHLIQELQKLNPHIKFEGIAGAKMLAVGCHCFYPQERLAVFGAFEILHRLAELRRIHRSLYHYLKAHPPALFIGIDAPEFNLSLEKKLRRLGIKTIHYVSPSVWAWRPRRVHTIAQSVNLILALFPFEVPFYQQHHVPVKFVGHPLARMITMHSDKLTARAALGLSPTATLLALLPGSRMSEVKQLMSVFLAVAKCCVAKTTAMEIVIALVNERIQQQVRAMCKVANLDFKIHFITAKAQQVMAASDVLLVASGTATLEAMLIKRPMIVVYRINFLSYWLIARWLIKTPFIALPNILANEALVPEFIQYNINVDAIVASLYDYLDNPLKVQQLLQRFKLLHESLLTTENNQAAKAVQTLLNS